MGSVFPALYLLSACAMALCLANPASASPEPAQFIREQHSIEVLGQKEIWQLVWEGKPTLACGPNEVWMAITCPCAGEAYGESGHLQLVRRRNGIAVDRMELTALFGTDFDTPTQGEVSLQRWPIKDSDLAREDRGDPTLVPEIKRRPAPIIMRFADYSNAGAATVFLLQVGTLPCGKLQFAAVGLTPESPHLHALATVTKPGVPLIMPLPAWQALLAGPGQHTVPIWNCGDHGSDRYSELVLQAKHGQVFVKERQFSCTADGSPDKLLSAADH